jgi:hypothetical protein
VQEINPAKEGDHLSFHNNFRPEPEVAYDEDGSPIALRLTKEQIKELGNRIVDVNLQEIKKKEQQ